MELKSIKTSFYQYLHELEEKEILILMNYISVLIQDFNLDYSKFKETINKELSSLKLKGYKQWEDAFGQDDIFEADTNETENYESNSYEEDNDDSFLLITSSDESNLYEEDNDKSFNKKRVTNQNKTQATESVSTKKPYIKYKEAGMFLNKNLDYLKSQYDVNKCPGKEEIKKMVEKTKLSYSKIYFWFREERDRNNDTRSIRYSDAVLEILEKEFQKSDCPVRTTKLNLVKKTKLTYNQISTWFSNRKKKSKLKGNTQAKGEEKNSKILDKNQLEYLQEKYKKHKYPSNTEIEEIADELNLTYEKIFTWFSATRSKNGHTIYEKHSKEVIDILKEEYQKNKYPTNEEKEKIASRAKLSLEQVTQLYKRMRLNKVYNEN